MIIGYIYNIVNSLENKRYVGKTIHLEERIKQHFNLLEQGIHHSKKLQDAFDTYGRESFFVTFKEYPVNTDSELSKLEAEEIAFFDSCNNGYNMNSGTTGNSLPYKDYASLYQILQRYDGVQRQIERVLGTDRHFLTSLKSQSYYQGQPYNEDEVQALISKIGLSDANLKQNYIKHNNQKLSRESCLAILSVLHKGKGYDKTLCEVFGVTSKLTYRLRNGIIYKHYIEEFSQMSEDQKESLYQETMNKYQIESRYAKRQRRCVSDPLTQDQIDYILDNKGIKSKAAISRDLNISSDRVNNVIKGISYKDLVKDYYIRHQENCGIKRES